MKKNQKSKQNQKTNASERTGNSYGLEPPKLYRKNYEHSFAKGEANIDLEPPKRRNTPRQDDESLTPAQRRKLQNKKRKMSKLKRKIILYTALSLVIIAIFVVLSLTVLFKINTITIKGNEVYDKKQILAVLPIQKEDNLILIDKEGAANKVKENLPYIYEVEINRKLPSTVVVTVKETPRVYYIKNADKKTYTFLDDNFKVLENKAGSAFEGAIEIKNAEIESAVIGQEVVLKNKKTEENIKLLANEVNKLNLEKITAIYSKDINNNYMVYDSRLTFKLGNIDNLDNKIYSALSAVEKLNETNPNAKGTITATGDKQIYFTAE